MSDALLIAVITGVFGLVGKALDLYVSRSKAETPSEPKKRSDIINPTTHGGILNPSTVGFLALGIVIALGVVYLPGMLRGSAVTPTATSAPATVELVATTPAPATPPVTEASQLKVGGKAIVHTTAGDKLRIHKDPSFSGAVTASLDSGTVVTLLEGPVTIGSDHWWRVQADDGRTGWAVEFVEGVETLQPLP